MIYAGKIYKSEDELVLALWALNLSPREAIVLGLFLLILNSQLSAASFPNKPGHEDRSGVSPM